MQATASELLRLNARAATGRVFLISNTVNETSNENA